MTVAESIARWLHEKGIVHAFGIVGGGNVAIWEAITRLGATELVCVHHEQAAAMAATYYYRVSGRLPLCLVSTGAGSANAISGVLAAYFDSIPLLVISGNEPSRFLSEPQRVKGYQGYRSHEFARPICKGIMALTTDPMLERDEMRAMARAPRQGPVWIDVAKDIQTRVLPA
jgi:acetolactate synthase-1/2/3 large subunit